MDAVTAILGDVKMARFISSKSKTVSESMKSPLYASMMKTFEAIGSDNSHLTTEEVDMLTRKRNSIYDTQHITRISDIEDLADVTKETIQAVAMASKYRQSVLSGALSTTVPFTAKTVEVLADSFYGGTAGKRKDDNGKRDFTAKKTFVISDRKSVNTLGNLSMEDKRRLHDTVDVVNDAETVEDPFEEWTNRQIQRDQAERERIRMKGVSNNQSVNTQPIASGDSVDWTKFLK